MSENHRFVPDPLPLRFATLRAAQLALYENDHSGSIPSHLRQGEACVPNPEYADAPFEIRIEIMARL